MVLLGHLNDCINSNMQVMGSNIATLFARCKRCSRSGASKHCLMAAYSNVSLSMDLLSWLLYCLQLTNYTTRKLIKVGISPL